MSLILFLIGFILLVLAAIDSFITILSLRGAGPLAAYGTSQVWKGALRLHDKNNCHKLLSYLGPLMAIATVLVWYSMINLGWILIFLSSSEAVLHSQNSQPATVLETIYFVGSTLSGVGYGDYLTHSLPWTFFSNVSALSASFLVSVSLSYLLPVVSAAVQRKKVAHSIFSIGSTPPDILQSAWAGEKPGSINNYIMEILNQINDTAHKHLAYPVLAYFHSTDSEKSPPLAILTLYDAILISRVGFTNLSGRLSSAQFACFLKGFQTYSSLAQREASGFGTSVDEDEQLVSLSETWESLDLETGEKVSWEKFTDDLRPYLELRAQLVQLCQADGWCNPKGSANTN